MSLPNGGKIVIVDDKYNEIEPLVNILNERRIPVHYYNGIETLPEQPLDGIRLIFLDLTFSTNSDVKTIVSRAMKVIDAIIGKNNGPYLLAIWSAADDDTVEELYKELQQRENAPEKMVTLSKSDYFETVSTGLEENIETIERILREEEAIDSVTIGRIIDKIQNSFYENDVSKKQFQKEKIEMLKKTIFLELEQAGLLSLFVEWENSVRDAVPRIVNDIYVMIPEETEHEKKLPSVVDYLAKNNLEKKFEEATDEQKLMATIMELNEMFSYFYDKETELIPRKIKCDINNGTSDILKSKKTCLNTWKMIRNADKVLSPGVVFCDEEKVFNWEGMLPGDKKDYPQKIDKIMEEKEIEYVMINITGECDIAQDKAPVIKTVPAVLIPVEVNDALVEAKVLKKGSYKSYIDESLGSISYNNKEYIFLVNAAQATYILKDKMEELKMLFKLTRHFYLKVRQVIADEFLSQGGNLFK